MPQQNSIRPSLGAVLHPERYPPFPEITGPREFQHRLADNPRWVLANFSHAVYHPAATIERLLAGFEVSSRFYNHRGAQGLLAQWDGNAVVAFRGSQVKERRAGESGMAPTWRFLSSDVLADLRFRTVALGGARVHRGFLGEFNKLWENGLEADLEALRSQSTELRVWATGHSLGGAMATLAGLHRPLTGVVTFGEPRVGRRIEAEFKADNHTRVVNGRDLVTRMPPRWFPFRYRHHGERVALPRPGIKSNALYDHAIVLYSQNLTEPSQADGGES